MHYIISINQFDVRLSRLCMFAWTHSGTPHIHVVLMKTNWCWALVPDHSAIKANIFFFKSPVRTPRTLQSICSVTYGTCLYQVICILCCYSSFDFVSVSLTMFFALSVRFAYHPFPACSYSLSYISELFTSLLLINFLQLHPCITYSHEIGFQCKSVGRCYGNPVY